MFSTWQGLLGFFGVFSATSFLVFVWLQGRRSKGGNSEENALHRIWVKIFVGTLLLGVVGVEGLVRSHGGWWDTSWLAWLHMALVIVVSTLFCLLYFRFTGLRDPARHRVFAYVFIFLYFGMLVTGGVLLSRYPG
ncbi:MAG: hypothetical protein A3C93_05230 [Candidatus Lloydbacteria bacterium RIFCSPHIGHO2_02_FULL_54_17]|uniref:Uncharacterized protein n=1 Tax=Candidatus Lloydbacteria bacterium RIFCSPHIGHO2_02_FULL_54_17 TaxID=1798664 RepID=A0A1G2DCF0_9BACT|nr:MAG: hypothetical protein A2762_00595 [Candidatus Lloydbacteria bacterium RIFCSPHIGHO2_01_FULL_54_11]OGZ11315.1 MAG: hypothetical protein A3C93_05230 [Candidatus Lloydbacteria bacterium RIFCSPHIGHO2_02_FULL_54_17]OGZ13803.1 MAG: hypothetical protein A2948_03865 [Candidatus Lloydbacteria bacterium RIFCSPLOWO2_01_FULL_54_18]